MNDIVLSGFIHILARLLEIRPNLVESLLKKIPEFDLKLQDLFGKQLFGLDSLSTRPYSVFSLNFIERPVEKILLELVKQSEKCKYEIINKINQFNEIEERNNAKSKIKN